MTFSITAELITDIHTKTQRTKERDTDKNKNYRTKERDTDKNKNYRTKEREQKQK